MNRLLVIGSLALTALCVVTSVTYSNGGEAAGKVLAHDVYFTLIEDSPEARTALADACRKYLSGHEGTHFFATGLRAAEMTRDVNDMEFDVSLHVYFEDDAAHAAYQKDPRHLEFIEKMKANWKSVRVFDSRVRVGS